MWRLCKRLVACCLPLLWLCTPCQAQDNAQPQERQNFLAGAAHRDFSAIWRHNWQHQELFDSEGVLTRKVVNLPADATLGFIGPHYQRFYIHYHRVAKDAKDPWLYHVTGKTRSANSIKNFTGTLRINKASLWKYSQWGYFPNMDAALPLPDEKPFEYGEVEALVQFTESTAEIGAGTYTGRVRSSFHLHKEQLYGLTTNEAGDFIGQNNRYLTTWNAQHGKLRKTCNWTQGSWIPGADAFMWAGDDRNTYVKKAYYRYGWKSFGIRSEGFGDKQAQVAWERADRQERRKWWLQGNPTVLHSSEK